MPYFDKLIHVYGWNLGILWSPLKNWTPQNFAIANFVHLVSKCWLRPGPYSILSYPNLRPGKLSLVFPKNASSNIFWIHDLFRIDFPKCSWSGRCLPCALLYMRKINTVCSEHYCEKKNFRRGSGNVCWWCKPGDRGRWRHSAVMG